MKLKVCTEISEVKIQLEMYQMFKMPINSVGIFNHSYMVVSAVLASYIEHQTNAAHLLRASGHHSSCTRARYEALLLYLGCKLFYS